MSRVEQPVNIAGEITELQNQDHRFVWHPFANASQPVDPLIVQSGEGAVLTLENGRQILDCISSWWVNLYGHGHPVIAKAIYEQACQLEQVIFAGFSHEPAIRLSEKLSELLPGDLNRVFFSDNGSTSVEVALKMAAQYWQNLGQNRTRVMAFDGGYHGDTLAAMSVGSSSGFFDVWRKWMIHVDSMPFAETWRDDAEVEQKEADALKTLDDFLGQHANDVVAMIMEPVIQGASGMRMCRPEFVRKVIARLREDGILVIFDEVMTGFGRTGQPFACQLVEEQPDIICLSKGLTGGFMPMSVTVASDRIYQTFVDSGASGMFCHGHSYTANPLGCAAALASMDLLQSAETADNWSRIHQAHERGLEQVANRSLATRLRLTGTIAALNIDVDDPGYESDVGARLKSMFWMDNQDHDGFLIRPLGNVVYLMPPYCMTDDQLNSAWQAIATAIDKLAE